MVRMADTYLDEENYEKAYILYLKFLTLFIEKIRVHPEYKNVSSVEKATVMKKVKEIMPRSEELKKLLKDQYENEYHDYQQILEIHRRREKARAEEERQLKMKKEGEKIREAIYNYHDEKEKTLQKQRDFEVALYHQLKLNQEENSSALPSYEEVTSASASKDSEKSEINVDRSTKPKNVPEIPDRASKPSFNLYSGSGGLRNVHVPSMLMAKFISIAEPNTSSNIETGGFLSGKLAKNKFQITHLIIPKQSGTSDSFTTSEEEAFYDYQEKHDLITLGWVRNCNKNFVKLKLTKKSCFHEFILSFQIHTHPSQTAFLSSVDLHTHYPYQLMLPEAIAIVIAPTYNETGFFSLTPDHGLDFIANCPQSGFHPHPKDPPLFAELDHVVIDENSDVTLVDLRKM